MLMILKYVRGDAVIFSDISEGTSPTTTYEWDFGAEAIPATATGVGPHNVRYSTTGFKTVRLIINDGLVDTTVKANFIEVGAIPTINLTGAEICGSGSATVTAISDIGVSIEFSQDNGESILSVDNSAPFSGSVELIEGETQNVTARAISAIGCVSDWGTEVQVISHPLPKSNPIIPQSSQFNSKDYTDIVCKGAIQTYTISGIAGSVFSWNVNGLNHTFINDSTVQIAWIQTQGKYSFNVSETSDKGCEGTVSNAKVLISEATRNLGNDRIACEGDVLTLSTSELFSTYAWGNGSSGSEIQIPLIVTAL